MRDWHASRGLPVAPGAPDGNSKCYSVLCASEKTRGAVEHFHSRMHGNALTLFSGDSRRKTAAQFCWSCSGYLPFFTSLPPVRKLPVKEESLLSAVHSIAIGLLKHRDCRRCRSLSNLDLPGHLVADTRGDEAERQAGIAVGGGLDAAAVALEAERLAVRSEDEGHQAIDQRDAGKLVLAALGGVELGDNKLGAFAGKRNDARRAGKGLGGCGWRGRGLSKAKAAEKIAAAASADNFISISKPHVLSRRITTSSSVRHGMALCPNLAPLVQRHKNFVGRRAGSAIGGRLVKSWLSLLVTGSSNDIGCRTSATNRCDATVARRSSSACRLGRTSSQGEWAQAGKSRPILSRSEVSQIRNL